MVESMEEQKRENGLVWYGFLSSVMEVLPLASYQNMATIPTPKISWTGLMEIRLIEYFSQHEFLYNTQHLDFKKKSLRRKVVLKLAAELGVSVAQIQWKWKNLRTYYVREWHKQEASLRNGAEDIYIPKWEYFKFMSFLNSSVTSRDSMNNTVLANVTFSEEEASMVLNNEIDNDLKTVVLNNEIDNDMKTVVLEYDKQYVNDNSEYDKQCVNDNSEYDKQCVNDNSEYDKQCVNDNFNRNYEYNNNAEDSSFSSTEQTSADTDRVSTNACKKQRRSIREKRFQRAVELLQAPSPVQQQDAEYHFGMQIAAMLRPLENKDRLKIGILQYLMKNKQKQKSP